MNMEDLTKLIKILGYTTSTNDNEALNACRRANELMKSMNLTWMQLVVDKTIIVNEIVDNKQISEKISNKNSPDIEIMLQVCMSKTNFSRIPITGQDFIKSINDWYQRNGNLTDKQKTALIRWYNNI